MAALKRLGLAALMLVTIPALAAAPALTPAQAFDLHVAVIVHGDPASQATLGRYLGTDTGRAFAAALATVSHLQASPELADWPQAATAARARQRAVRCTAGSVRHPQADIADVDYRCLLPDLTALLPVYREHPVPFDGPHRPQMSMELATAYTQMIAEAPARERLITVSFRQDPHGGSWRIQDPGPLMGALADAFLPFFEWNEHPPGEDR